MLSPRSLLRSSPLQPLPACGIPDLDMKPPLGRAATEAAAAPADDIARLQQALGQTIDALYDV